ncbi:MAG: hypothetical protein H0V74_09605 [Chloroflexi bacterium]|nr:hypothetical protein [Chloroflexota bacterium]
MRPRLRTSSGALLVFVSLILAACASAPATPPPTSTSVPAAGLTPIPHLTEPATAAAVFTGLGRAGVRVAALNADASSDGREPLKRLNATLAGWPLTISEFLSAESLRSTTAWKSGAASGLGQAPVALVGLNVLVEWGPRISERPILPTAGQLVALAGLVAALDPLIGKLESRSIAAILVPGGSPARLTDATASAAPSSKP